MFLMKTIHANISQTAAEARNTYRSRIELLRSRAEMLAGRDKLLMTMYLDNGNTFRQMALLAGTSEASIARRIHRVTKRLIDSKYITCIRNRDRFTGAEMTMAKDYFLFGLSIRKIAAKRQRSFYGVRKTLKEIQRLIDEISADEKSVK